MSRISHTDLVEFIQAVPLHRRRQATKVEWYCCAGELAPCMAFGCAQRTFIGERVMHRYSFLELCNSCIKKHSFWVCCSCKRKVISPVLCENPHGQYIAACNPCARKVAVYCSFPPADKEEMLVRMDSMPCTSRIYTLDVIKQRVKEEIESIVDECNSAVELRSKLMPLLDICSQ